MKRKKRSYPPFNVATSLMLVIFIVLCMVVFAVLSLSNTVKDYKDSQRNVGRTTAYYEANNQAEEMLAKIDDVISHEQTMDALKLKLENLEGVSVTQEEDGIQIQYEIPIREQEVLAVTLEVQEADELSYQIKSWKQHVTDTWSADETLPVLITQ